MLGLKVQLSNAQRVKQYLLEHDLLEKAYLLTRKGDEIVFPVVREFSAPFDFDVEFVDMPLTQQQRTGSLREALEDELTPDELNDLVASYDIVGSIAIIEVPETLLSKAETIAAAILRINPSVKTVLRKTGGHEGEYRVQRMALIAGEDTRLAMVTENGCKLRVHVEEAYYSVRMATERGRIAAQIKEGERILCLFSGVAPYPIVFSRHTKAGEIVGVEINPKAHELAVENVATNRCTNVHLLEGDAHDVLSRFAADGQLFDRITMPLPHTASEFLEGSLHVLKHGGTIHYYTFKHENEMEDAVRELRETCTRVGRELLSSTLVKAGAYSPRVWRVCVDGIVS